MSMGETPSVLYTQGHVDAQAAVIARLRADLDALLVRCMQSEAVRDLAIIRGNEYYATIARVRDFLSHTYGGSAERVEGMHYIAVAVLRALDGSTE